MRRLAGGLALVLALPLALTPARPAHAAAEECSPAKTQWVAGRPDAFGLLGVQTAWRLSTGRVTVAVVDTGINAGNTHLGPAVLGGTDLVDGGDGRRDSSGHGTAVAGIIAARTVPGSGLVGVAPDADLLPVRVYDSDSDEAVRAGRGPSAERTAAGIVWAADHGAKVIAVPHSTPSDLPVLRDAVATATARGALVVASAGNATGTEDEADAVRFPAGYPQALSVTALDADGQAAEAVNHGVHVEVAAPGARVLTTFHAAGDCILAPDQPSTSFATGYAAGVAALVAARHPGETPADWEYRILATGLRPSRTERDARLGWGIVAPEPALNVVNDGTAPGPANPRFAPPVSAVVPAAPPVVPPVDQGTGLRASVGALAVVASALVAAALLVARLRGH